MESVMLDGIAIVVDHKNWFSLGLLGGSAGVAIGLVHFLSLKTITNHFLEGSPLMAFIGQILRLALLASVFMLLARMGSIALLSGVLGLLLAREAVFYRLRTRQ